MYRYTKAFWDFIARRCREYTGVQPHHTQPVAEVLEASEPPLGFKVVRPLEKGDFITPLHGFLIYERVIGHPTLPNTTGK